MNREQETEDYYREVMDSIASDPQYIATCHTSGRFLLHDAALDGQEELVRILLQRNVDVNQEDGVRRTALHQAARSGWPNIVTLLLQHGAETERRDIHGMTPLLCATTSSSDQREQVVAALRTKAKLDLNTMIILGDRRKACDVIKASPSEVTQAPFPNDLLDEAIRWEDLDLIRVLLDHGADVNATARWSRLPPLLAACHRKAVDGEIVSVLLERGADPNGKNLLDGRYAIDLAKENQRSDLVSLLRRFGAVE
jgi:ankyrin repeat protein